MSWAQSQTETLYFPPLATDNAGITYIISIYIQSIFYRYISLQTPATTPPTFCRNSLFHRTSAIWCGWIPSRAAQGFPRRPLRTPPPPAPPAPSARGARRSPYLPAPLPPPPPPPSAPRTAPAYTALAAPDVTAWPRPARAVQPAESGSPGTGNPPRVRAAERPRPQPPRKGVGTQIKAIKKEGGGSAITRQKGGEKKRKSEKGGEKA